MDVPINHVQDENRRIRLLRVSADLLVRTLMTTSVTISDADNMIRGLRRFALKLFPDKGEVFDLIYVPRFRRALREAGILRPRALALATRPTSQPETEDGQRDAAT